MGRMKEIFIDIRRHNDGEIPTEMTIADVARMKELEIYNWRLYEFEIEKLKKTDNPHAWKAEKDKKIKKDEKGSNSPAQWSPGAPF